MITPIIELDGETLSIEDIIAITRGKSLVRISNEALKRITHSAEIISNVIKQKRKIYGVTTGFGYLQNVTISLDDVQKLQKNLIVSHSAGVGEELPEEVVKGAMVLQINKFARGHSGIRSQVVLLLSELLNKNIIPVVPSKGSLGASGDLAPLAHLSLVLIGKGLAYYNGERMSGSEALTKAGLNSIKLVAKEGLALLNGTQIMTSIAAIAVADADYLIEMANLATAMSMEVHAANIDAFNPLIHHARPHKGQIKVAKLILDYLKGSKRVRSNIGHQDSYSIRCVPAVHGATLDTLEHVKSIIEIEMNSSTDNPLIFSEDKIYSGGNFHGQPIAYVMDFLSIVMAEIGNISERRIERLLNPTLSGLPAFLTPNSGLNSGFMIAQYTAASLVSENKQLSFPASIDSIPVSANQEDHVSMGTHAANKARKVIENLYFILAVELLCVSQAINLTQIQDQIAPTLLEVYQKIRKKIPELEEDRELTPDINLCVEMMKKRELKL